MSTTQVPTSPDKLTSRLRQLAMRVRGLAAVRGIGIVGVLVCAGMGVALGLDWLFGLDGTTRMLLLAGTVITAVLALVTCVIWPFVRAMSTVELAAMVDTAFPELGERIEAAIELTDPDLPASHRGSDVMREHLVDDAVRRSDDVDFTDAVETSSALRWLGIGMLSVMLLLAPFGLSREGYALLLRRFFTPWENVERATNLFLVVENGDRAVARGSDVTIAAEPRWRIAESTLPESARLHWINADGETDSRRMEYDIDAGTYEATLPHVLTSFDYEVTAGSARTQTFHINVVDAPDLKRLMVEIDPPAYTGLPARTLDGPSGRIDVFEHSELEFQLEFTKPVTHAQLVWLDTSDDEAAEPPPPLLCDLSEDGLSATLTTTVEQSGQFLFDLRDRQGVANPQGEPWRLVVTPDAPPVIEWADTHPVMRPAGETLEVRPNEQVPLPVLAVDDVGVSELELHAEIVQRKDPVEPVIVDESQLGQPSVQHEFLLDLSTLSLQEGDLFSVRARAVDGRPVPGPQEAWTEPRLVRISADAESIEKSELAQKQALLRGFLEGIQMGVQEDRRATDELREQAREAAEQQQQADQQEAIAELNRREQEHTERLEQVASVFDQHPLQRNIAEPTREVGSDPLSKAQEQFERAEASSPEERLEQLTRASDELARADQMLDELLKGFDELAELEQDLMRLQQLAEQAEQLSKDVEQFEKQQDDLTADEQLNDEQRRQQEEQLNEEHERLQDEQQSLAGGLDRLLEERPEVLDAARQQQQERLQQLGEMAERLAEQEQRLAEALKNEPTDSAEQSSEDASESESSGNPENPDDSTTDESSNNPEDRPANEPANASEEQPTDGSDSEPSDVAARQQELAEDAARLALETARSQGVENPAAEQAREFAERSLQAADEAQAGLLPEAAEQAESAAELAEQTNEALHDPTDPAPGQLGQKAEELARRQQELAKELRQQADDPAARQQAQQQGQQRMTAQTESLTEQLEQIAERLEEEPLSEPEQAQQASDAQQSAGEATEQMQQAQQSLEQGQPQQAAPSAQQAAESLQQAAQQMGAAAQPEEQPPESPVPGEVGEQVTDARRQLQQAGEQLSQNAPASQQEPMPADQPPTDEPQEGEPSEPNEETPPSDEPSSESESPEGEPMSPGEESQQPGDEPGEQLGQEGNESQQNASQSMQQVAESLRQAAQQLGMAPAPDGEKGKPSDQEGEPSEGEPGDQSGTAGKNPISLVELEAELRKMNRRDWGRLPGTIESELFQSTQKKPDADYARLIRLYFEEVSRRRSATDSLENDDQ